MAKTTFVSKIKYLGYFVIIVPGGGGGGGGADTENIQRIKCTKTFPAIERFLGANVENLTPAIN